MSLSLWLLISTTALLFLIIELYIIRNRKNISIMSGMMTAMTKGMLLGLLAGTILGVYFADNLFISTIIGMLVGLVVGGLIGIPSSLLATLDGMLSGLMGGMMGAMIGEMVPFQYSEKLIKLLFLFEVGFSLVIIYLLVNEGGNRTDGYLQKFINNPFSMILTVTTIFIALNLSGPINVIESSKEDHQGHSKSINSENNELFISAGEFNYVSSMNSIRKGEIITLTLQNDGEEEHDIQLNGVDAEVIKMDTHQHNNDGIHVHADAGKSASITFKPLNSGSFDYFCTIPGHKEAGMVGVIDII